MKFITDKEFKVMVQSKAADLKAKWPYAKDKKIHEIVSLIYEHIVDAEEMLRIEDKIDKKTANRIINLCVRLLKTATHSEGIYSNIDHSYNKPFSISFEYNPKYHSKAKYLKAKAVAIKFLEDSLNTLKKSKTVRDFYPPHPIGMN